MSHTNTETQLRRRPTRADDDPAAVERRLAAYRIGADGRFGDSGWLGLAGIVDIADFDPTAKADIRRARIKAIRFAGNGRTDSELLIWSGDTLMDLTKYQALKMTVKTIDGSDYLFVEAGGFSTRNKPGWTCPWCVLIRTSK